MNQPKKKKEPGDIENDPAMIELERMIEAGELDEDRVTRYADNKSATKRHILKPNEANPGYSEGKTTIPGEIRP